MFINPFFDTFAYLSNMVPAVIFSRVSSNDQSYQRQLNDLQTIAEKNNWQVLEIITTKISATKTRRKDRADLDHLLNIARKGKIKKVLITEVSRLGRRPAETCQLLEELTELGVSIFAQNYGLETLLPDGRRNPAASMLFIFFSEQAKTEIELTVERIRSGMQEAKSKGKHIARPKGSVKTEQKLLSEYSKVVRYLKENTNSIREIAKICSVSPNTVMKVKKALNNRLNIQGA